MVIRAPFDQEPEDEHDLADERELTNGRVTRGQHSAESIHEVPEPGNHQEDAENPRHETAAIGQVADQQQVDAEENEADHQIALKETNARIAWSGPPRSASAPKLTPPRRPGKEDGRAFGQ